MSYVRASEESDVYVIADARSGFTCYGSNTSRLHQTKEEWVETRGEMLTHLLEHRVVGDQVPDEPIERLQREMKQNRESL